MHTRFKIAADVPFRPAGIETANQITSWQSAEATCNQSAEVGVDTVWTKPLADIGSSTLHFGVLLIPLVAWSEHVGKQQKRWMGITGRTSFRRLLLRDPNQTGRPSHGLRSGSLGTSSPRPPAETFESWRPQSWELPRLALMPCPVRPFVPLFGGEGFPFKPHQP